MGTKIVEARLEHAPFLAWVSLAASRSHLPRGFWDFFLAQEEPHILRYLEALATTSTAHLFHYSTFLVAEVDGAPAAALCGYFDDELGYAAVSAVGDEVDRQTGRDAAAGEAGLARIAPFVAVLPEHESHAWVIENVATLPAFRRRGLVDGLLHEVIDRGVKREATSIDIGVLIGNDPAQRAYEKVGFRVVGEKRNAELEAVWGTPGIRALSYAA